MINFHELDFTTNKFRELCISIAENYPTITLAEYFKSINNLPKQFIIMRHDVDGKAGPSLRTALIENEYDIRATYYFRTKKDIFVPGIIKQIKNMGHEIGYHYETLSTCKGDYAKAFTLFGEEVNQFRSLASLDTISMHGASLSKYDNRNLWDKYDFKKFGIIGEAYLSIGKDLNYFTDTGRGWNSKYNLRDYIPGQVPLHFAETTDELIELIKTKKLNNLYITLHPDRWTSSGTGWVMFWFKDFMFNTTKRAIRLIRN